MVLALALIAFFSVVTVSLAKFEDVSVLQVHRNQVTAATDSPIEGAAAYSIADASRGDWTCIGSGPVPVGPAGPLGPQGSITMADAAGTVVGYSTNACNPQKNAQTFAGFPCSLCALGTGAGSVGISINKLPVSLTAGGTAVSNWSISASGGSPPLLSAAGGIYYYNGAPVPTPANQYSPTPIAHALLPDPLGYLPSPLAVLTATTNPPLNTRQCASPCPAPGGQPVWLPGYYGSTTVSASGNTYMDPGVYVITGTLTVQGQANLVVNCGPDNAPSACAGGLNDPGVLLYFTCGTVAPPSPQACTAANPHGGALTVSGQGSTQLQAASAGLFARMVVYYDRLDVGPLVGGTPVGISISGKGSFGFAGATYALAADITINGNGATFGTFGPIVSNSISLSGSGHAGTGLTLQGKGAGATTCTVFDNELNVAGTAKGHDGVQAGPGCVGGAEIVGFNYAP